MMKRSVLSYPWLSIALGAVLIVWFLISSSEELIAGYSISSALLRWEYKLFAAVVFLVVILLDTVRFFRHLSAHDLRLARYEEQVAVLLNTRRELQTRAHKYSRHADKLKLFISDRLLEYIEYDERFIHFKNIAAEVRHNGVISYDKVQSTLQRAKETSDPAMIVSIEEARRSLTYFWDLLDLVTADNVAMHVANTLYECEEHLVRAQLEVTDQPAPIRPTFSPRTVLAATLSTFLEDQDGGLSALTANSGTVEYKDANFTISLQDTDALLGNENHFVLLAENLINNALAHRSRGAGRKRVQPVIVNLHQVQGEVCLSIYNRGIHIPDANRDDIFKLGFSTRRGKDKKGKGLGLYFVREIVRGYEGSIEFHNIGNQSDTLSLRVVLDDDSVHTEIVDITTTDDGARVQLPDGSFDRKTTYRFDAPIRAIEATSRNGDSSVANDVGEKAELTPRMRLQAPLAWRVDIENRVRSNSVELSVLDVTGVSFEIRLPGAQTRLELDAEDNAEFSDNLDEMRENFRELQDFD